MPARWAVFPSMPCLFLAFWGLKPGEVADPTGTPDMGTTPLAQAYSWAKDLLSPDRAEPRPRFIVTVISFMVTFSCSMSITHLTRSFVLGPYGGWVPAFVLFLSVVLSIVACGKQFSRYYLDKVSLICIVVFPGFLGPMPAKASPGVALVWIVPQAILAVWLYRWLRRVGGFRAGKVKLINFLRSIFGGAAVAALFVLVATRFNYPYDLLVATLLHAKPLFVIDYFARNMSIAAAIEEPIFRGFLLGYLVHDRNWKPSLALIVQAAVFTLPHVHYMDRPFTFWIVMPCIGIVLGLVTLRTGNIATAMFGHAIYSTILHIVAGARGEL